LNVGAKLFDHAKNTLGLDTAKKLIRGAIVRLEDYGFEVANLQGGSEKSGLSPGWDKGLFRPS